jgi:S1-C subfamily serine protease
VGQKKDKSERAKRRYKTTAGLPILTVAQGSPAERAGLQPGDVLLALNGTRIESSQQLSKIVAALSAGTQAEVNYLRDGNPVPPCLSSRVNRWRVSG